MRASDPLSTSERPAFAGTSGGDTRRKAAVDSINKGLEADALRAVIDRTFTFDEMVKAHRYLEQNGQFGKIVVTV
jgi:NADPH:quinone reductase-like Zn-dependent oxidoreductase